VVGGGYALPHTQVLGSKNGERFLLLDAILVETVIAPTSLPSATGIAHPLDLAVVYWLREEDPTASFTLNRPPLPLQHHPGLGILRRAFRVVTGMAAGLGKDGVGSLPKFFHDAVIFHRSRLFLFLDGREQGRFEAMVRDLRPLPLGDASLALIGACVRDERGAVVEWKPGLLVFPLSARLAAHFNSPQYAAAVAEGLAAARFSFDEAAVARTRALVGEAAGG